VTADHPQPVQNNLYYGDNYEVLKRYVKDESVDLIYLDPPFHSRQIIFSVKAGGVSVPQVRDLRGVIEREGAEIGVFLCFEEPTRPMLREAAEAGLYKSPDGATYPRIQVLTIQDILDGKQPLYPAYRRDATYKQASRAKKQKAENYLLPLG